jgi:YVTN family beta-propeller protein
MKEIIMKSLPATLAFLSALFLTGCADKLSQEDIKDINSKPNGLILTCDPQTMTINVTNIHANSSGAASSEYQGEPCEPSMETVPGNGQQGGQPTTKTENPQPQTVSAPIKSTGAAPQFRSPTAKASSPPAYQLQDDYETLLPLPFGPLFSSTALASYSPPCTPNVFVYAVSYANAAVARYATCPFAIAKVIQVPPSPIQVALTPDASTAVVTTYNNAVAFIDTATDTVTTLSTPGYNPYGVAISPDGTKAYITSYSTSPPNQPAILVINMTTRQLTTPVLQIEQGNSAPKSIFLTPDGAMAWVIFSQTSFIQVIDTLSMTVSATVNVGGTADTGMAFSPDGTRAYVSVFGSGLLAVFDTASLTQLASIPVAAQPTDVLVSKDGNLVYVNSYASNGAQSVISTATNTVIATIPQTGPVMGLALFH